MRSSAQVTYDRNRLPIRRRVVSVGATSASASAKRHAASSLSSRLPLRPCPDEVADLVQCHEVAHLAADGRHADLEPALGAAVAVAHSDHDRATAPDDPPDPVARAEVVDVEVERSRLHPRSRVTARRTISPMPLQSPP